MENGFEGALLDNGGNAADAPALRFACTSFDWVLRTEGDAPGVWFFFMSTAAFNFSGVVPKLARVLREASDNVVCFKSCGTFNAN